MGSFGLYILFSLFISLNDQKEKKVIFVQFFKKTVSVFIALLPSLILWVIYWTSVSGYTKSLRFSVSQLINDLYNIKSLIGYEYSIEASENNYLFILLCILFLYIIIYRVRLYRKSKTGIIKHTLSLSSFFKPTDFWLLLTFLFFLFYFIIPDRLSAGNISARLSILLFIFFVIWLSVQKFSKILSAITVVIIVIYSINIRVIQNKFLTGLETDIKEICELNTFIEPNSVYYTFNYNQNWIKIHFLNYVGVDKPLVSAELSQCYGPFPIVENENQLPVVLLGDVDLNKYCHHCSNRDKTHPEKVVDYIITGWADNFSNSESYPGVKKILDDNYNLIYTSSRGYIQLYKLK
ncbi:MAG: hypothetical protein K8R74_15275 [Bacteroidales bacterium]|nr:hypothetical protein [Bacteroidales bacterium]